MEVNAALAEPMAPNEPGGNSFDGFRPQTGDRHSIARQAGQWLSIAAVRRQDRVLAAWVTERNLPASRTALAQPVAPDGLDDYPDDQGDVKQSAIDRALEQWGNSILPLRG